MTPEAETLLLIMAANGGVMHEHDMRRELQRVLALDDEQRAEWKRRIMPLVQAHARRALGLD